MTESRKPYVTHLTEPYPITINEDSQRRLMEHINQFWNEGCRGVVVIFDGAAGFTVFKLTREKRA